MSDVDPRVAAATREQLEAWRRALDSGAERIGWKIGLNIPEVQERLGLEEPVIGHLTSATAIETGGSYDASGDEELKLEPEVAIELGADVDPGADVDAARDAIVGYAAAIELVDVGRPPAGFEGIIAGNIFHRAVVLGPSGPAFPMEGARAEVAVNDEPRAGADAPDDYADVVQLVARLLDAAGERLQAGDRIIAGSLTEQVALESGDHAAVDLGPLGRLDVRVT